MIQPRLDSEERRRAIVEAALPLFARKGFARTTTKEIAEAAGVSEALVFKHFPSKAALYEEIARRGCEGDPALERLCALEPSTSTLVHMTHLMVHHFLVGVRVSRDNEVRQRLMVNSYLEDGEYSRLMFDAVFEAVFPQFQACLDAARRAGHLLPMPGDSANAFWFGHHVAAMAAYTRLPGRPALAYRGSDEELIGQTVRFILRGLGLKDELIADLYNPKALSLFLAEPPAAPANAPADASISAAAKSK